MGGTIPLAMFAIRSARRQQSQRSFSFLYIANVMGAVAGAALAPSLVELYGFHGTLQRCAVLNGAIFVAASALTFAASWRSAEFSPRGVQASPIATANSRTILLLLFTTGLATMAAEVVWIRLFTYFVGPFVYSFAEILAAYLLATFLGSQTYRFWSRRGARAESRLSGYRLRRLGCCLCSRPIPGW